MKSKLPEQWNRTKLEEVAEIISGGTPKRKELSYWDGDIPWISVKDFPKDEKFIKITDEKITEEGLNNSSTNMLQTDDIIISARGTVGNLAVVTKPMAFNQSCYGLRSYKDRLENNYLYYFLKYDIERLKSRGHGSVFNTIIRSTLNNLSINLPSLQEQKIIADTLSSLDDKIELNNIINKNLEAQAQAIFRHWFVDFEFPNEEGNSYKSSGGKMIKSELGLIPSDWIVNKLGKNKLGTLVKSGIEGFSNDKIYLATADVANSNIVNEDVKITFNDRPSRANMQPNSNTLWFAKMKDSRKLILVDEVDYELQNNYIFSTGFAGLQASKDSVYYLWTYLQSESFDIIKNSLCTGTTMQSINNSNINRINIIIPSNEIFSLYNQIVRPMFRKIAANRYENRTLAQLRDTLLPKLMSGEIRIPLD